MKEPEEWWQRSWVITSHGWTELPPATPEELATPFTAGWRLSGGGLPGASAEPAWLRAKRRNQVERKLRDGQAVKGRPRAR